jgi:hypothetical protein
MTRLQTILASSPALASLAAAMGLRSLRSLRAFGLLASSPALASLAAAMGLRSLRSLRAFGSIAFILGITVVPLALGWLIVGGAPPVGRNTRSTTRVGHLAFYWILEELGYRTRRFERGLETLPEERAVLVALEPGPALFRRHGRFAKKLVSWVAAGNAALVTLGPDPDREAEVDDGGGELGLRTKRAVRFAEEIRDRARERADVERPSDPDTVTAIDFEEDLDPSESWDAIHLFTLLAVDGLLEDRIDRPRSAGIPLSGPLATELGLDLTRPRALSRSGEAAWPGEVLLESDGRALAIELRIGQGKLILVSEPRMFQNGAIGRNHHGRIAAAAIDRLASHAGTDVVWFEEFSHGGREASNLIDLALTTRARWMVAQLLLLVAAYVLWASRRDRSIVPVEVTPRRSKDEVIDAMASLFVRANDSPGALRRLVELTRQRWLGSLPAGSERALVALIAARARRDPAEVAALLSMDERPSERSFLERAKALGVLRREVERG